MTGITEKQLEVIRIHAQAEYDNDVEATMATVCDNPRYELITLGLALTTKDAVREFYSRTLPPGAERKLSGELRLELSGPDTVVGEYYIDMVMDGEPKRSRVLSVIVMEGDLFKGERVYGDQLFTEKWITDLGPDFASYPGVVPL